MNANGQLSPGITDLYAVQDTNSAPFARHKLMHMVTHSKSILDNMSANNVEEGLAVLRRIWNKEPNNTDETVVEQTWAVASCHFNFFFFCLDFFFFFFWLPLPTALPSSCALSSGNLIGCHESH